ncbi:MAG TPA: DUF1648 domain-containing protein [Propionicimonas sp.]|nr:DUF1648 domain-containing protein [Propionicimonas sp.]HQA77029.1 DUF1648 domain-containing protein [Propionicimonas sp.]HQD96135.1 DUF1648 domain-containing protein [Propionicimonas sp.]
MTSRPAKVPNRVRTTVLALVVPLVLLAAALAWAVAMLPELPDQVATHWGADGLPDGFGSPVSTLVMLAAIVVPFTIGMWAIGFYLGSTASTRRLSVFFSIWFAVMISGLLVGSLAVQRGLTDATLAPGIGVPMAVSFAVATLAGALAALAIPADRPQPTTAPVPDGAERLTLGANEQAAWVRTAELPGLGWIMTAGAILTVLLGGIALLGGVGVGVTTLVILAMVTLLLVLLGRWTVTVDHDGLAARSVLPRPRTVVPLNEVEAAEVVDVQPLADFGGWGYRIDLTGRVGIVLRKGEAILVHRTGGRQLVITVDDAATGVALLNTLADRARLR